MYLYEYITIYGESIMPTWNIPNYQVLYMNSNGNLVSDFKAEYDNSMAFIVYPNGFKIPAWLILGESFK